MVVACEPECVVETGRRSREDMREANMDERHDSDDEREVRRTAVTVGLPVMMPDGPCDLPDGSRVNGSMSEECRSWFLKHGCRSWSQDVVICGCDGCISLMIWY